MISARNPSSGLRKVLSVSLNPPLASAFEAASTSGDLRRTRRVRIIKREYRSVISITPSPISTSGKREEREREREKERRGEGDKH